MSSDRWIEQAQFMRTVGAVHAEWCVQGAGEHLSLELVKLTLAPAPPAPRPAQVSTTTPPARTGGATERPAASLARMHETMFAASRMRPKMRVVVDSAQRPIEDVTDVPRAASAKKAAARGAKKAEKRSTRNA